jgi:hypothetical protein
VNVVLEGELAEDEEELIAPPGEGPRIDVEDGGDVVPDVADGDGLGVELQKGNGFVVEHGCAKISRRGTSRSRTRGLRCHGSSPFQGSPGQSVAGPLGRGVVLLRSGGGFRLSLEGVRQGGGASLGGGSISTGLLLGLALRAPQRERQRRRRPSAWGNREVWEPSRAGSRREAEEHSAAKGRRAGRKRRGVRPALGLGQRKRGPKGV